MLKSHFDFILKGCCFSDMLQSFVYMNETYNSGGLYRGLKRVMFQKH